MIKSRFWLPSIITISLLFSIQNVKSQCTIVVESSFNYEVTIEISLTGIDAPSSCPWGYNFNIELDYNISFHGPDAPGSLYTLQGEVVCDAFPSNFFGLPNSGGSGSTTTGSNPYNPSSDCATVTTDDLGCNIARIQINGPGIPNQFVDCSFGSFLPITLLSFKATPEGSLVNLAWITGTELNNDYFSVERSTDGTNWTKIKEIKGAGNSSQELTYSMIDYAANYGLNYYRLKQTDFDGKYEYSDIRSVNLTSNSEQLSIYPNPANQNITIAADDEIGAFEIYNAMGELVHATSENYLNTSAVKLDISHLPKGLYFVRTSNNTEKFTIN